MCSQKYSGKLQVCVSLLKGHILQPESLCGQILRQRRRFRPWYIYSICLVRQRFRHPNCAKPHIGISCHGNYSLSLIWFDCQGDSWMPKVWVSNNRSLLRLITRPVVCACQDFLCTLNCPWICEIYSCLVHHQYYRKTWNPISVCWIFSKHISLNTWDNNKTIGNQDKRRRRRRRCPVRPVWPHQPRSSSKLPCPLTPPASSRPRTTWPLWLRTTCKQILDSFCWTFTSRSKNTTFSVSYQNSIYVLICSVNVWSGSGKTH